MWIDFLGIEIPQTTIDGWKTTVSADPRYVEKQAIEYIRANSNWTEGLAVLFNGDELLPPAFGQVDDYAEEGYYIG